LDVDDATLVVEKGGDTAGLQEKLTSPVAFCANNYFQSGEPIATF